jgi:TRAP-type C4-dicarboxylate transport system permease small subunit
MLRRLLALTDSIGEWIADAGMVLISIAIFASIVDIACRKTIGFSITGINDIMQLFVMACICLAMPLAYIREGHVGVDFITDPLSPRALAALKFLVAILTTLFVAMLTYYAYGQAMQQINQGDKSQTLGIPIVFYWAPLLIGMGISAIASFLLAIRAGVIAAGGADPRPQNNSPVVKEI